MTHHHFKAENHMLCRLCQETIPHMGEKNWEQVKKMVGHKIPIFQWWLDHGFVEQVTKLKEAHLESNFKGNLHKFAQGFCKRNHFCDSDEDKMAVVMPLERLAAEINNDAESTWTATVHDQFQNITFAQMRQRLGAIVDPGLSTYHTMPIQKAPEGFTAPDAFDPRQAFPYCAGTIGNIRDQSSCGSCWAFGSTEAFEDRSCIANKTDNVLFSTRDTAACCNFLRCFSNGCNGGQPAEAWNWFQKTGVVTGGKYSDIGNSDTCEPYPLAPCSHHVAPTKYPKCPESEYPTPKCVSECTNNGYKTPYHQDKHKATRSYGFNSISAIQADIMQYGSATAAFTVYADFPNYKSGVYQHKSGQALGGHAIKMVGWGVENGTPYWLIANSWNDTWGDGGYFKILRGSDECGIESQVSAGQV